MILPNSRFMTRFLQVQLSFIAIVFICFLTGCEKENEDPADGSIASLSIMKGDNQQGIFGELLKDTILLKVSRIDTTKKFKVIYEFVQGNGALKQTYYAGSLINANLFLEPDKRGLVKLRWRLGCNSHAQKIKFSLYPAEAVNWKGEIAAGQAEVATLTISASGQEPTGWGRSCGCEEVDPTHFKILSHDNKKLYMVNRGLFYSEDQGVNWYKVNGIPNWDDIVEAQFNSKGWLYVLTRTHGLYYSQDLIRWESIHNGILDYRNPTAFTVTDSTLFVSFDFDGLYKTDNNGAFWRKLLVAEGYDAFHFIRPHTNGKIYLFDKWNELFMSENGGKNWQRLSLSYSYVPSQVYDFQIDKDGTLYIGGSDATIAALSPLTYTGERRTYYQWNGWAQHVSNIRFFNEDVYYLVNHNPQPGIYSKNNNWGRIDLNFAKPIRYYYIKNDGKFLLASDGLYYRK